MSPIVESTAVSSVAVSHTQSENDSERPMESTVVSSPTSIAEVSPAQLVADTKEKLVLNSSVSDAPKAETTTATIDKKKQEEAVVLVNVNVRVRRRPLSENEEATFDSMLLPELCLPRHPTLDDMRQALCASELGNPDRDIFFPKWNKSLYVTIDGVERNIDKNEQLSDMVQRELETPGTFVLNLQECRDARYSRRKQVFMPQHMFYPYMMYSPGGNNAVYFDGAPPSSYYHPYACQFMPPFPMQFMYVPMHGNQN